MTLNTWRGASVSSPFYTVGDRVAASSAFALRGPRRRLSARRRPLGSLHAWIFLPVRVLLLWFCCCSWSISSVVFRPGKFGFFTTLEILRASHVSLLITWICKQGKWSSCRSRSSPDRSAGSTSAATPIASRFRSIVARTLRWASESSIQRLSEFLDQQETMTFPQRSSSLLLPSPCSATRVPLHPLLRLRQSIPTRETCPMPPTTQHDVRKCPEGTVDPITMSGPRVYWTIADMPCSSPWPHGRRGNC